MAMSKRTVERIIAYKESWVLTSLDESLEDFYKAQLIVSYQDKICDIVNDAIRNGEIQAKQDMVVFDAIVFDVLETIRHNLRGKND